MLPVFLLILLGTAAATVPGSADDIAHRFLRTFEMDRAPKPKRPLSEVKIPDFLVEQYKAQTGLDVDTTNFRKPGAMLGYSNTLETFRGRLMTPKREKRAIMSEGETTMANGSVTKTLPSLRPLRLQTSTILEFDFRMSPGQQLQAAYVKVFWKPHLTIKRKSGGFKVTASDLIKYNKDKGRQISSTLDIKKFHHRDAELDEGWYEFDVTSAVSRWLRQSPKSTRIILDKSRMKLKSDPSISVIPEGLFLEPHLLVYSESEGHRSTREKRAHGGKHHRRNNNKRLRRKKGRRPQSCARHSMRVDFTTVGWNDWIVSPPGYDAHVCTGECKFPLPDHANATNHAIVQTMVNGVNPSTVPQACCIPTELSPISMLYIDEYEAITLKNYENMVVEACGCR